MEEFLNWANGGYSQGLAVVATAYGSNLLAKKWKGMSKNSADRIKRVLLLVAAQTLKISTYLAVFGYLVWQLAKVLRVDAPPTRDDVFAIAFWTFWALLLFVRMIIGPFGNAETKRSPTHLQSHSTSAKAPPSQSECSPPSSAPKDAPLPMQPRAPESSAP